MQQDWGLNICTYESLSFIWVIFRKLNASSCNRHQQTFNFTQGFYFEKAVLCQVLKYSVYFEHIYFLIHKSKVTKSLITSKMNLSAGVTGMDCGKLRIYKSKGLLTHYPRPSSSSSQCRLPGHRSRSSSLSLTVESALESFDFLNTSDFDDEDTGDDNAILSNPPQRSPLFDTDGERIGWVGDGIEAFCVC